MDFSPYIHSEQKRIAVRTDAVGMGFDASNVARLPPKDAA